MIGTHSIIEKKEDVMSVKVYSKPACVQCTATTRALDMKGIDYEVIDLTKDADAMAHISGLGYRQAPVVVADDLHWSGFRPDMISKIEATPEMAVA